MNASTFLDDLRRFWAKVDTSGDCWLWTGEKNNHGYGRFVFWHDGRRGARMFTHRLALMLSGVELSDDDVVMHTCDVPACVRVAHLRVGTQRDNMHDAIAKGRLDMSGLAIGWELKRQQKRDRLDGAA